MSSKHLIDVELLPGLAIFPSAEFSEEQLPAVRRNMEEMAALVPVPDGPEVNVAHRMIGTPAGHEVGIIIYTPTAASSPRPGLINIHGGGYVAGSAKFSAATNWRIAAAADCVIVSVDYRLAPETPHPGPVEDCYAALKWLHDNARSLGVDPARIAVSGESAGGGLAAALALLARDRGEVALIHQHLSCPMLDDRTVLRETNSFFGEFVWTPSANRFGWASLLGCEPGKAGISPYAAAARAENLAGLPSTFIAVGAVDLFLEENMEYARRLMRAGVPTELHIYPGAYHGFQLIESARIAKAAKRDSLEALKTALHRK